MNIEQIYKLATRFLKLSEEDPNKLDEATLEKRINEFREEKAKQNKIFKNPSNTLPVKMQAKEKRDAAHKKMIQYMTALSKKQVAKKPKTQPKEPEAKETKQKQSPKVLAQPKEIIESVLSGGNTGTLSVRNAVKPLNKINITGKIQSVPPKNTREEAPPAKLKMVNGKFVGKIPQIMAALSSDSSHIKVTPIISGANISFDVKVYNSNSKLASKERQAIGTALNNPKFTVPLKQLLEAAANKGILTTSDKVRLYIDPIEIFPAK